MSTTPVVNTDTSGNKIETREYTDTSGNEFFEKTTYYGEIPLSKLFSSGMNYFFILLLSCFGGGFLFIFFWLFSKGGPIGTGLFGLICLGVFIFSIYSLFTYDRNNTVKITRFKDESKNAKLYGLPLSIKGNLEVSIYSAFVGIISSILVFGLYVYLSANKIFSKPTSSATNTSTNRNIAKPINGIVTGGKRKKTQRK